MAIMTRLRQEATATATSRIFVACRYESASLPVMTYFFPACPGSVSVATATAAMSRVSTNGILPSPEAE
jgi:hypothetical protein